MSGIWVTPMSVSLSIGIIGGGQLARMMIPASLDIGVDIRVLAEDKDASAAPVLSEIGDFRNSEEVFDFSSRVTVLTFDHEHVPLPILRDVRESGTKVYPRPEALDLAQDKIRMRQNLAELGVPQPRWTVIDESSKENEAVAEVGGYPCIAKSPIGGYDGRGVRVIYSLADCQDWLAEGRVLLEELVPFTRELSQLSARRPSGQWVPWPVVETRQVDGVCSEVIAGAIEPDGELAKKTKDIAERIAKSVDVVGVLAVELFETPDGRVLVNELAMRPHNSGHVFTELSITSQFEQHLRAVGDLPLGSTDFVAPFGAMANVFGEVNLERQSMAWKSFPHAKIHNYRKSPRPGRKAGHIVIVGSDLDLVLRQTREAKHILQGAG